VLEIKNTQVFGLERALVAAGNAMTVGEINTEPENEELGPRTKDVERGERLGSTGIGSGHDHFLLGIHVQFDIKYSQYWTIEAERYHNFEIISSQSKMHKLTTMGRSEDFNKMFNKYVYPQTILNIKTLIKEYNELDERDRENRYRLFMIILSNLPIDLNEYKEVDDWDSVKRFGVEYIILRIRSRYRIDTKFVEYYEQAKKLGIKIEMGGHSDEFINDSYLAITSPGIPPHSEIFKRVKAANVPIKSEVELAYEESPKPFIAIILSTTTILS
jgi:hypothetical protein